MTLKDIIDKYSGLEVSEKRAISDAYNEIVFYNKDWEQWNRVFQEIFGQAIKPAGTKPSVDDLMFTKDYGGIAKNQTLYKRDFNDTSVIAMFWPWQDNVHTTLKLAILENKI